MLPWIGNRLAKIPYLRKKIEQRQVRRLSLNPQMKKIILGRCTGIGYIFRGYSERAATKYSQRTGGYIECRTGFLSNSFALYFSDEYLDILCQNVRAYMNKLDEELKPVKVKNYPPLTSATLGGISGTTSSQETKWILRIY